MVRVKVCGITNYEDAIAASELGADAIGFIFADSPRRMTPRDAAQISWELPPMILRVGVFVNENEHVIQNIIDEVKLDIIQLHGDESPNFCDLFDVKVIKTVRVKDENSLGEMQDYNVDGFLLDTFVDGIPGGTGKTFDWSLAEQAKQFGPVILSGGLNPDNVLEAIGKVKPYGVDTSSGVERFTGKKDLDKLRTFLDKVKGCRSLY